MVRRHRLTASNFGRVRQLKSSTPVLSIQGVKNIYGEQLDYGRAMEGKSMYSMNRKTGIPICMLLLLVLLCHLHIPFWQLHLMPISTIQQVLLRLGLLKLNALSSTESSHQRKLQRTLTLFFIENLTGDFVSKISMFTLLKYRDRWPLVGEIGAIQVILPEAVVCCLQTCNRCFVMRAIWCTSVPSWQKLVQECYNNF